MREYILALDDVGKIVEEIKATISDKESVVVLLQGDLASGKTTFVKHYVKSVGIDDLVTSPTFSLQTMYGENIYHYDIYNKTLEDFISLGLLEEFEKEGLHFVEWGDNRLKELLSSYGFELLTIKIEKLDNKRRYSIHA